MKKSLFVIAICIVAIAANSSISKATILAKKDAVKRTLAKPVRIIEKNIEQMCSLPK
ncbi:MAG: hypothetical protein V4642_14165 [Bacteroidota bacterium]